ncbi:AAA family ATPase [Photobacterium leiognathi]|uniref:AAA family ATPase n=1 Tax=Photobacterium leiognathi TaxID=553611 RepID=UPI003AF35105
MTTFIYMAVDLGFITYILFLVVGYLKNYEIEEMNKYIQNISGVIPNTHKNIDIILNGRNLIITGGNGSGKTCLITDLFNKTDILVAQKQQEDLERLEDEYLRHDRMLSTIQKGTPSYDNNKNYRDHLKEKIAKIKQGLELDIPNNVDFSSKFDDNRAVISFFEAHRKSDITEATTAKGIESEKKNYKAQKVNTSQHYGNNLEQHLVNLRNRRSLAITEDEDFALADKIHNWFAKFDKDLQLLLEDQTAKLKFESSTLKFTISQKGKPEYTFQSLSSGYKAIFNIYADLLLRTEYFEITPSELTGAVFIDEIDAHLHVSLQRLIFPFLVQSFPNIQFIVTTHSPFVLMSVEDVVIYDLSKNEQVDGDVSMYSHTSIIEGLLNTKIISHKLDKYVNELSTLINSDDIDYSRLELLLEKLRGNMNNLDSKSKSFFMLGENILLDRVQ